MYVAAGYHNSLDNILKRLGLWEGCAYCLDLGDERCWPSGNDTYLYDLSPSQIIMQKGATTEAPTSVALNVLGIPPHLRANVTTVRHMEVDNGDFLSSWYNTTDSMKKPFKWQGMGVNGYATWSVFSIYALPTTGTAVGTQQYGHNDLTSLLLSKGNVEGLSVRFTAADTMQDIAFSNAEPLTSNEWTFGAATYIEAAATVRVRQQSVTTEDAADPYDTPGWLGDGPIIFGGRILADGTKTPTVSNNSRLMMQALWPQHALSNADLDSLHAEIKATRITDLE
jgi:hypothetical protein